MEYMYLCRTGRLKPTELRDEIYSNDEKFIKLRRYSIHWEIMR
jgi:hypothetical protein